MFVSVGEALCLKGVKSFKNKFFGTFQKRFKREKKKDVDG
jgi:hypothetical protein